MNFDKPKFDFYKLKVNFYHFRQAEVQFRLRKKTVIFEHPVYDKNRIIHITNSFNHISSQLKCTSSTRYLI